MRIGMLGLAGAGKKTLFNLLTGAKVQSIQPKGVPGVCKIRDSRVDALTGIYKPKKTTYAQIDFTLLPDVEKTQGKAVWMDDIRNVDGLCCVIRAFENPSVFHPVATVNPARDLDIFLSELLFADLVFVEKRIDKLSSELRRRSLPDKEKELELIKRISRELENGAVVRKMGLTPDERKILSSSEFLTDKGIVAVVNLTQGMNTSELKSKMDNSYGERMSLIYLDAKLEEEISQIENPEERKEFLSGMGIEEPAINKLTRTVYEQLGLMSYFTVGEDEVRAWTVKKGSTAPVAGRAIHSDIERGFIRAEMMKYPDLIDKRSETALKEAGKFYLKGKDYVVEDGDILSFRVAT